MYTKKSERLRAKILDGALSVIRRDGIAALTQPRVAAAARIRQSHLTYYFPTRSDLVAAVAEQLAQKLLAGFVDALAAGAKTPAALARNIAALCKPEQTRLLLTLVLAADCELAVRQLFRRLTRDVRAQLAAGLAQRGLAADSDAVGLFHALCVGLAVLDLARDEPAARREIRAAALRALSSLETKPRRRA